MSAMSWFGVVECASIGLHLSMRKQFTRSCYLYTVIRSVWHGLCLANSLGDTELTAEVIFFGVRPPEMVPGSHCHHEIRL